MPKAGYAFDGSRAEGSSTRQDRLVRRRLRNILRGELPRVPRRRGDASWTYRLSTLRGWVSKSLGQRKARKELETRPDLELLQSHTQAMMKAFQEAEERVREEIARRIEAEENLRREAEARLELERVARREAERRAEWLRMEWPTVEWLPARPADSETIMEAQREMMSRVEAEQLAIEAAGVADRDR